MLAISLYKYIKNNRHVTINQQKLLKNNANMQREHYVIRNEIPICGIQLTAFECKDNETSMQTKNTEELFSKQNSDANFASEFLIVNLLFVQLYIFYVF